MRLLHLSDIHGQPGQPLRELANSIADSVRAEPPISFLVATGDLALKGGTAQPAVDFLRELSAGLAIPAARIICCPGNHDLGPGPDHFQGYLSAFTPLLGAARSHAKPAILYTIDGVDFLIANSAHHLDHTFGLVDLNSVNDALAGLKGSNYRVVITHHHSIPTAQDVPPSHIRNAYEFLRTLEQAKFNVLLHGHSHVSLNIKVGEMKIIGVGTVNYPPEKNINNQFNIVELGKSLTRYRFVRDMGIAGQWIPTKEVW